MSRKTYSPAFKRKIVGLFDGGESAQSLADRYKLSTSMIYTWRKGGDMVEATQPAEVDVKSVISLLKQAMPLLKAGKSRALVELALYTLLGE